MYKPIALNRQYFRRRAAFCLDCNTGACYPSFEEAELRRYYREFYWAHRNTVDGQHVPAQARPNDRQIDLAIERLSWVSSFCDTWVSAIDFGAGDCAAAYVMRHVFRISEVHVVDPSTATATLATRYGLAHSSGLDRCPVTDLVYSAHSIEHVHDLLTIMGDIIAHVRPGGIIFFETPNIDCVEIFSALPHTPHTYMLSSASFAEMERHFPVKIMAIHTSGPRWSEGRTSIRSEARTDFRVLLRRAV